MKGRDWCQSLRTDCVRPLMSPKGLCQTWGTTSSVSALGVFLGTSKPPIGILLSLHTTCRDVRRSISETASLQSPVIGSLITSSYKTPRSAASFPSVNNAEIKLLHAISSGQLDTAMEELKLLKSSGCAIEPYSIEKLVEGVSGSCIFAVLALPVMLRRVAHSWCFCCSFAE